MKNFPVSQLLLLSLCSIPTVGCDDKSSSSEPAATAGQLAIATDFADMGLSTALAVDIPAAMKNEGTEGTPGAAGTIAISLPTLTATHRSIEGCEVRRSVKNGINIIREMAQEVCYVEAGAKALKPNGKYHVNYEENGLQGKYSVWIDDTVADRRRISLCGNGVLRYVFDLEAANGGKAKGALLRVNGDPAAGSGDTWTVQGKFDVGVSQAGRTQLDFRGDYRTEWGSSRERLHIAFEEKGLAFVSESKVGQTPLDDGTTEQWTTQSAALLALNLGSVLNRYSFQVEGSDAGPTKGASRSYFDGKGNALEAAASEAWNEGQPLYVAADKLPALPSFEQSGFADGAWDCTGSTEVQPEGSDEDYAKCDALAVDWQEEQCEDEAVYAYSGDEVTVADNETAQDDAIWEQALRASGTDLFKN